MVFSEVYLDAEEALRNIFSDFQEYTIENYVLDNQDFKVFRVFGEAGLIGWAIVADEMGKTKPITFLVGVDREGQVLGVYVLEFRDIFGSEIRRSSFLRQFKGKTLQSPLRIGHDIDAVTSATISSEGATSAVKRALRIVEDLRHDVE